MKSEIFKKVAQDLAKNTQKLSQVAEKLKNIAGVYLI